MDSASAFQLINHNILVAHAPDALVNAILANKLAKFGHRLPLGLTFFDSLSACISLVFLVDSSVHNSLPACIIFGLGHDIYEKNVWDKT